MEGNVDGGEGVVGAAGYRDFGADDVADGTGAGGTGGGFCGGAEARGAVCDELIGEVGWVVETAHAGVEMDLREAGLGVLLDHAAGAVEGGFRLQMLPGIGAEVVAAEDEVMGVKADAVRDFQGEVAEEKGGHAGVAALLVDLVGGGLEEEGGAVQEGLLHGGFDDPGVGGADGIDSLRAAVGEEKGAERL